MTTGRFLREGRDVLLAFTRALSRAQRWMAGVDGKEIADLIAPAFPDIASEFRHRAVARYLGQDTWARDPMRTAPATNTCSGSCSTADSSRVRTATRT